MGKRRTAADLIGEVTTRRIPPPPDDALPELNKIVAHNDAKGSRVGRVSLGRVVEWLAAEYGYRGGMAAFRSWFAEQYGRGWEQ